MTDDLLNQVTSLITDKDFLALTNRCISTSLLERIKLDENNVGSTNKWRIIIVLLLVAGVNYTFICFRFYCSNDAYCEWQLIIVVAVSKWLPCNFDFSRIHFLEF